MNKPTITIAAITMALTAAACGSDTAGDPVAAPTTIAVASPDPTATVEAANPASRAGTPITITAGNQTFTATLNETAVARDFSLPCCRGSGTPASSTSPSSPPR